MTRQHNYEIGEIALLNDTSLLDTDDRKKAGFGRFYARKTQTGWEWVHPHTAKEQAMARDQQGCLPR